MKAKFPKFPRNYKGTTFPYEPSFRENYVFREASLLLRHKLPPFFFKNFLIKYFNHRFSYKGRGRRGNRRFPYLKIDFILCIIT
jgi:hypothetical protein